MRCGRRLQRVATAPAIGAYRDEIEQIHGVLEPTRAAERLVEEATHELEANGGAVVDAAGTPIASGLTHPDR